MITLFCHKCGSKSPDDSLYCRKCGTKLAFEEDAAASAPLPSPKPSPSPLPSPLPSTKPSNKLSPKNDSKALSVPSRGWKKARRALAIIAACVVALIVIAAIVGSQGEPYTAPNREVSSSPDTTLTPSSSPTPAPTSALQASLEKFGSVFEEYIANAQAEEADVSYYKNPQYVFHDIDQNGTDELLIQLISSMDGDIHVFSYADGNPIKIGEFWSRKDLLLDDKGGIYSNGSNGYDSTIIESYRMSDDGSELITTESWTMDGSIYTHTTKDGKDLISQAEFDKAWESISEGYAYVKYLPWRALATTDPNAQPPTQKEAYAIAKGWVDAHPEENVAIVDSSEIYLKNGVNVFYLFDLGEDKYYMDILVHTITGELYVHWIEDGEFGGTYVELLEKWYADIHGLTYGQMNQNPTSTPPQSFATPLPQTFQSKTDKPQPETLEPNMSEDYIDDDFIWVERPTRSVANNIGGGWDMGVYSEPINMGQLIVGRVKNVSGRKFNYVQIMYTIYDSDGNQIASAVDMINNLAADGVWKFSAAFSEERAARFEFAGISAF